MWNDSMFYMDIKHSGPIWYIDFFAVLWWDAHHDKKIYWLCSLLFNLSAQRQLTIEKWRWYQFYSTTVQLIYFRGCWQFDLISFYCFVVFLFSLRKLNWKNQQIDLVACDKTVEMEVYLKFLDRSWYGWFYDIIKLFTNFSHTKLKINWKKSIFCLTMNLFSYILNH